MKNLYTIEAQKNGHLFVYTGDGEFAHRNHDPKIYSDKEDAIDDFNTVVYRNDDEHFVISLVAMSFEDD